MDTTLHERVVSGFPLSIGTSLAMESIFQPRQPVYDLERPIPQHIDLSKYDSIYINVATLYRNLMASLEKQTATAATPEVVAATLEEEIGVINDLFASEGHGVVKPIYYRSDYRDVKRLTVPGFKTREAKTENQIHHQELGEKAFKILDKRTDSILKFSDLLSPDKRQRSLILTHIPYDLLAHKKFSQLDLLESNTGILKPKSLWYTKYYPISGAPLLNIPFTRRLLLVFGDKVLIQPMPLVLRKQILDIAKKYNWTANTTEEKVDVDIGLGIHDPYTLMILGQLK